MTEGPEYGDAASVVARTPRLLEHIILCSLEDDDPVPTLIAWQLVSRACLGFARADAVWNELLSRRCYHQPMIHEPAHLYDDPVGEQLREGFQRIVAESTRRPWQAYSARSRLDKVVRDLFNGLINATSGKLSYYNTIVRVGLQGLDEIGRQLASIDASEEDWLSRRWYAHELIKSVTAHEACLWWRAIDKQESAKYAGMVKRNAYDAAFTSLAFVAGGDPESILVKLDVLARDVASLLKSHAALHRDLAPENHAQLTREVNADEFPLIPTLILEAMREALTLQGFVSPPVSCEQSHEGNCEDASLDLLLPNEILKETAKRNDDINWTIQLRREISRATTGNADVVKHIFASVSPTCHASMLALVFCAVTSRLPDRFRMLCEPMTNPSFIRVLDWTGAKPKLPGAYHFNIVRGGMSVLSTASPGDKTVPAVETLTPCAFLHLVAKDIKHATKEKTYANDDAHIALPASYAAALIPALVQRPAPAREASVRVSLAACELAPLVETQHPFDAVPVLQDLCLPLLGTQHAKIVVGETIARAKANDAHSEPKRRLKGRSPAFRVGDLVVMRGDRVEDSLGVVVGWDLKDAQATSADQASAFYSIISTDRPVAYGVSHYIGETALALATECDLKESELGDLVNIPVLGRYFGSVVDEHGKGLEFVMAPNLQALYPDDVRGASRAETGQRELSQVLERFSDMLSVE